MDTESESASTENANAQKFFAIPYGTKERLETLMGRAIVAKENQIAEVIIEGEKFIVPIVLISIADGRSEMLSQLAGEHECRIGDTIYPFMVGESTHAEFDLLPQAHQENQKQSLGEKVLLQLFVNFLAQVGGAHGGTTFILHKNTPTGFYEPIKNVPHEIHVFMGMTPMFEHDGEYPERLFGINVEAGGYFHRLFAPSKKRGVSLSDGVNDVVQIVGNNIYLLFNPILLYALGEEVTMIIFRKAIALAMNWFVKRGKVTQIAEIPLLPSSMEQLAEDYFANYQTLYRAKIAEAQKEVASLEDKLRSARRNLMHITMVHRTLFNNGALGLDVIALMVRDHARIISHPLVSSATLLPKVGFEIRTKRISIEHDGVRYTIAQAFVCRFDLDGTISIWAEGSYHPKGFSHPHISPAFGYCFGNIGDNIEKAVAEYRYGDAVEYLLIWLTEGYTPENVIHSKIEEWPIETDAASEVAHA